MDALDGNAIAGLLVDVFGDEMTMATGVCATCNTPNVFAEMTVYLRAPGTVARCWNCHNVVMVFTEVHGVVCVDLFGLAAIDSPNERLSTKS
jgi:uncharacterized protein DUF6510